LLLGAALYFCRPLLLPILTAMVIGATLGPIVKRAATYGISPWFTALALAIVLFAAAALAVTLIAAPVSELIARAPEIGASIKQKLYVLDRPLAAWRELQSVITPNAPTNAASVEAPKISAVAPAVVEFVTPALAQLVVFVATLILFLAVQGEFRRYMVTVFSDREAKLRVLRIANDVEHNLASYLAVVTIINVTLGVIVTLGAWAFGFPSPVLFGLLAAVLNYIPYIGPACMVLTLFGVGLVTFPTLGYALLPPACFVALTTAEGHVITPTILGRRLTLNPLTVFLALAFWTWMWGPMGAFLAVPMTIVALVIFNHVFPSDDPKLPE
jgi:predicted PurR-regulated permease PerM